MGILAWLVVGLRRRGAGPLGHRRDEAGAASPRSWSASSGAFIGGALYRWATGDESSTFDDFDLGSVFIAFLGAVLLLLVLQALGPPFPPLTSTVDLTGQPLSS